jgi:transposase
VARRAKVDLFEQIRREYEFGVGTIKGVARRLGVHRRLVREALAGAVPPPRKTPQRARPKMADAIPRIDAMLEADRQAPRKQRHTAHRVWERLRTEPPVIEVSESTVRQYVRQRKREIGLTKPDIFIAQSYAWGVEAQVDWYEAWAELDGLRTKLFVFSVRSMASGAAFHCAYRHATQQAFLDAHERAFGYFGGVFGLLRYDNLKSAVQKILRGSQRKETTRFHAFRLHWGFESQFCSPAQPHEKGGVEGEAGYFRRNHWVPVPTAASLEALNEQLRAACHAEERRAIQGRDHSIGAALAIERTHLRPLAREGFDLADTRAATINTHGCAPVLTNHYSTPLVSGTSVEAKVYADRVEIWHAGACVARHERSFGRHQKVLELEHYLEPLSRKPGALAHATALEQWRAQGRWPPSYDTFWARLSERYGKAEGTRQLIELLLLGRAHGQEKLRTAIEQTLTIGSADAGMVRYVLLAGQQPPPRGPAEAVDIGALARYEQPLPSVAQYDALLERVQAVQP